MSNISKIGEKPSQARSCQRCNEKKIGCNKAAPCGNCLKSNSECIFPGPGRAPRRKKRPLKAELVSRLRLLENEIDNMKDVTISAPQSVPSLTPFHNSPSAGPSRDIVHGQLGKLMPKSNYVTHKALLGLENEIGELKEIAGVSRNDCDGLDEITEDKEDKILQGGSQFIFGYSSMAISLEELHPSMAHSQILWAAYERNVAPVVTIFHKPTVLKTIYRTATNRNHVDRPSEAVAFAIYFSAVNSMDSKTCEEELGQEYSTVLQHYRFATQQALVRAGLFQSRSQVVLQAAVLFLTCLRRPKDAYFVWTMTAVVYRMAQGLGLHRDGTKLGLSPFEIEMRRRLWWAIYLLDTQSSEFHAIGPQIIEDTYDTNLPLNINDEDLHQESTHMPEERIGFTEMTFCLARIDMIVSHRRSVLHASRFEISSNGMVESRDDSTKIEQRLCELEEIHNRLRERYLRFCDTSIPIEWVTATVIRLALARSWVIAHPAEGHTEGCMAYNTLPSNEEQCRLFTTSIEVLEFAYLLETDPRTSKWSWYFERYPQWHSIIFILTELCKRKQTADTDRAWMAIEKAVARCIENPCQDSGIPLKSVYDLMEQATAAHGRVWTNPTS